jgi:peptidoglycan hydrolase CwlO-like protein
MRPFLAALICISALTFGGCTDTEDLESQVSKLQSEKQQLENKKRELQDKLSKYETGVIGVKSRLNTLKTDAEFLDRNVDTLKSYIDGFGYYEWHSVAANVKTATSRVATNSKDIERGVHDLESQIGELPKP